MAVEILCAIICRYACRLAGTAFNKTECVGRSLRSLLCCGLGTALFQWASAHPLRVTIADIMREAFRISSKKVP